MEADGLELRDYRTDIGLDGFPGTSPQMLRWEKARPTDAAHSEPWFRSGANYSLSVRSGSDDARIFLIIWLRLTFTVILLIPRSAAICLLSQPVDQRDHTSRSRRVNLSKRTRSSANVLSFSRVARSRASPS